MKEIDVIELDVDKRIENAINSAMVLYLNKLENNFIEIGLENTFQMHLSEIIKQILELYTFYPNERFRVLFEINKPINGNNDYIDIVIKYERDNIKKEYLIELKFKKITDSAPDLGNIESYKDIFNLDAHRKNENVCGCYYIFLTDLKTYLLQSKKGTRLELPMYDGYTIRNNIKYIVSGKAAKDSTKKYPNGFIFNNDYKISYVHSTIHKKDYWYFILKI